MKRFLKYVFILIVSIPAISLANKPKPCSETFKSIEAVFSNPLNLSLYKGQEGYLKFIEEKFSSLSMITVYNYVSSFLSKKEMRVIGWQRYEGKASDFRKERSRVLGKEEFKGVEGYVLYAETYYKGNMHKAFTNVSAVLTKQEFNVLDWQVYFGKASDFREERSRVLGKEEFKGVEGYVLYAERFYEGDMKKTFTNVSAVLTKKEFNVFEWQQYSGKASDFREERSRVLGKEEFKGVEGYVLYAETYYEGNMQKAFINVSALLKKQEFNVLDWQVYFGKASDFREERSRVLGKEEFKGVEGYVLYAERFYEGDMKKTFTNVSAVLTKKEFNVFEWQRYEGKASDFRKERSRVLGKEEFKGIEGYALYAETYYEGNMHKAFINVSALLKKQEFNVLDWQVYFGKASDFREERSRVLGKEEFKGVEGYVLYAERFYEGDMKKTFTNVSAVLTKQEKSDFEWKVFFGHTEQFYKLFDFFKNHNFEDYKGEEGQRKIAKLIFKNNLRATYTNVSTLRGIFI